VILCDTEIRALCEEGLVSPYDPVLVNPASLDVRLGLELMVEVEEYPDLIPIDITGHTQANPFWLRPGEFVLGCTLETFFLPSDVAAQFALKSTRARQGIEHLMAGYCDPGWSGSKLTLELQNARKLHAVALWPEMKIGQLVFHRMSRVPARDYSVTGHYNNDLSVQRAKYV
jgi:dCTP deaminase